MISVRFVIYDNQKQKIKKVIESRGFSSNEPEQAQFFINTTNIKQLFSRYKIDSNLRPMLYYTDTKTGEKTLESLD